MVYAPTHPICPGKMIKHARCERFRCIDVRALQRQHRLRSSLSDLLWSSDGAAYDVLLIVKLDTLSIYHPCLVDGLKKFATQEIPISWSKCHFGGERPWFNCPCSRRVAKLYGRTVASPAGAASAWPTPASSRIPECGPHAARRTSEGSCAGTRRSHLG